MSDPRSGARMRMYDFEWLIAERMDGARRFDEVASWAKERLGLGPSADDLAEFARKLRELGFFELGEPIAAKPAAAAKSDEPIIEEDDDELTPLPDPMPASRELSPPPIAKEAAKDEIIAVSATMPVMTAVKPEPAPAPAPSATKPAAPAAPRTIEVDPTTSTGKMDTPPPPKKSGSGSLFFVLLVLIGAGGAVVYMQYFRPQSAHVTVTLATPREVVELYDGAAPVKKAEAQTLSFGEDGKVTEVVAKGTEAKAGMPLATLDAYPQVEKSLADLKDRERFYEKQLAKAQLKNDPAELKLAEAKVAEKKKLSAELEARALKLRLIAPASGTVTDVLVSAGGDAKAGQPAVKLGSSQLTADFTVPAAGAPKVGEAVMLKPAGGGATIVSGRVARVTGGVVTVELNEGAAKPGDSLRLVRSKQENVVPVPAAAVVERGGDQVVFVLSDGEARMRKVTVVDRSNPSQVLISSGLATGDSVITSGADALSDGQKATTP
ncbi:MAG TPA: hypothetical protein VII38_22855 [Polyangia bacterium]